MIELQVSWDSQDKNNEGWFVEVLEDGEYKDDSMKVWFPVDVDAYDQQQKSELVDALKAEWPEASIKF